MYTMQLQDIFTMKRLQLFEITRTIESTTDWMWSVGLLQRTFYCATCDKAYSLKKTNESLDGYRFKCSGKICNKSTISIRKNSFFYKSKLPLKELLFLVYEWSRNTSIKDVCYEYEISERVVIDWFRFMRDIVIEKMILYSIDHKIGGVGEIVEIDETCVARRKYQVGRIVPTVWMLGGIVRSQEFSMFLEVVPSRSAEVLNDVIRRYVRLGTTIMTDGWGGYLHLDDIGYTHKVVNHSENFVDPDDPNIHTQRIESRWSAFKRWLRGKGTNYKPHLDEYLIEYLYRKTYGEVFGSIVCDITTQYPMNG